MDGEPGREPGSDGADKVRRLIAGWLSEPCDDRAPATAARSLGTGLAVPPAGAERVAGTARRLATEGLGGGPPPEADPGLRLLAEVLVLDEHPSAVGWTPAERAAVLDWVTLLVHRFGEDGVQRLVAELS
ncbi:hypothetical protein ACIGXM_26965 [Kitasatospora sp. NPDC052896]|uniref:hypothetical protein n=1 Tax=Kitasatospora sp. NPDC052896 TaxID=3364061 RepID=UPI0037C5FE74